MANILAQNNIRYAIDTLNTKSYGVISTAASAKINLTSVQNVLGITISGSQPAHTARYFAFQLDDRWGKLNTNGTFTAFTANNITYDNIESNGNTAAELTALSTVPALAGRQFGLAIAMSSENAELYGVPTCAVKFKCRNDTQILTSTEVSPIYDIGGNGQILKLDADTEVANGGSVVVSARITKPDGTLSDWGTLESFSGQKAVNVQFRGAYAATQVGISRARITKASVLYADGLSIVNGPSSGELYTITQDWYMPVKTCRLTVKHAPLETAEMSAYASLRASPVQVKSETLGVGAGGRKVYQLAHTEGLKYDSLVLYYDNVQVFDSYEFNCQTGRLTCSAPEGVIVSADYEYGWTNEVWGQMTLSSRQSFDGYDQSEYRYTVPESNNQFSVCALKLELKVNSGHITNELLGQSTGVTQSFRLSRRIYDGKVSVTANNATVAAKNWRLLDDPQHIAVTAPYGQTIRATYDWISTSPTIYEFYAVYAE